MIFHEKIKFEPTPPKPRNGDKKEFKHFAWLPVVFYNSFRNEKLTIWLESYTVTRRFHEGTTEIYDSWMGGELLYDGQVYFEE